MIRERDAAILARDEVVESLRGELPIRKVEIEQLKLFIAKLKRMQFGRKSEKLDRQIDQLELKREDLQADEEESSIELEQRWRIVRARPERKPLGIDVDFSLPSARVIRSLEQIIEWRGKPMAIRSDNGPEYVSATLAGWAEKQGIQINFIQPGQPQQNAYIERYNRTVRYDWLAHYLFESIDEVQKFATDWLWTYNHQRPNMALGGITPKQKLALAA